MHIFTRWLYEKVLLGGSLGVAISILFTCNNPGLIVTNIDPTPTIESTPTNETSSQKLTLPASLELTSEDEVGERLVIAGTIYADDENTPLPGAFITMWHTDAEGEYGTFRGSMQSDATGAYQLSSIRPAGYQVDATTIRAAHIHFEISATGMQPVSGELLFAGDPDLAIDPVVLETDPALLALRVISLTTTEGAAGPVLQGTFDVVLKSR